MEKVKVKLKNKDFKVIEYNGTKIHVITKLSISEQLALIGNYIETLLSEESMDEKGQLYVAGYYNRELAQMRYIINLHTNLEVDSSEYEALYDSDLWVKIKESIYNYKEFRIRQDAIMNEILRKVDKENSLSELANKFIEKFSPFVEKLLEMSPEELKELQDKNQELFDKLEQSPLIKDIGRQG